MAPSWKPVALQSSIHATPRVPLVPLSPAAAPFAPTAATSSNPGSATTAGEQTPHVESGTAQAAAAAKARMQPKVTEESESENEVPQCSENPSTKLSVIAKAIRTCVSRLRVAVASSDQAAADILWNELVLLTSSIANAEIPNLFHSSKMNGNTQKANMNDDTQETETNNDTEEAKTNEDLKRKFEDILSKFSIEKERNATLEALNKRTASKVVALEERIVRLTLDKGQHQNQASNIKQDLARETATKVRVLKDLDGVLVQLTQSQKARDELATNNICLEKALHALQEILKVEKDALSKEQEKNASLTIALDAMKSSESAARSQVDKLRQENKALWDRYKQLQAQHGQKLTVSLLVVLHAF